MSDEQLKNKLVEILSQPYKADQNGAMMSALLENIRLRRLFHISKEIPMTKVREWMGLIEKPHE